MVTGVSRNYTTPESRKDSQSALLSLTASGSIAPNWRLGLLCGLGGYVGAWLQPWLPERALRLLPGPLTIGVASLYLIQATR